MARKSSIELSVIIVNYNGMSFLKDCFESLKAKLTDLEYEIVVVDNDSTDDSCDYIKKHFPEVLLIECKKNLGFGRANNLGVKSAKGHTILLLNNDTILQDPLLSAFKKLHENPDYGIVSINMVDAKMNSISRGGRFPLPFRLIKISLMNDSRKVSSSSDFGQDFYYVDWVSGAFMLMRKSDFESVNGFDSDFFMYVEDVDLCKRLSNLGKRCVFLPNLSYIHFVGFNKSRENRLLKGYKIYASKHFSKTGIMIAYIMISINKLIKLLKKLLLKNSKN